MKKTKNKPIHLERNSVSYIHFLVEQQIGHSWQIVFEELGVDDADNAIVETQPIAGAAVMNLCYVMSFGRLFSIVINN